ncbi:MAG: DNA-3-methyladenine glycosylase 2 family protein [Actinobacteria bacterium]|nr:DNA-3-methyladenine glycosylase 2 family protein [Actinomycetota bacterium]
MSSRPSLEEATREVARRDKALGRIVKLAGPPTLKGTRDEAGHFAELVESIMYQQLAGKAAAAIHGRFVAAIGGAVTPEAVLRASEKTIRSAGVSNAKFLAVKDLAAKVADGTVPLTGISKLSDEEIVERLVQVRGIGRWTAEMFLIFRLRRLDVWPVDDLGVRAGWAYAHRLPEVPKPKELEAEGERFRPYRSVAAWYCWRAVQLHRTGGLVLSTGGRA